jgi:hypothetical protein
MKTNIKGNREKFKKQEREFEGLVDKEVLNEIGCKEVVQIDIDGEDDVEKRETEEFKSESLDGQSVTMISTEEEGQSEA